MSFNNKIDFPAVARDAGFKMQLINEGPFNWQPIGDIDVDDLLEMDSFEQIESVFGHLCLAPVDRLMSGTQILTQYLEVSQLCIQYLVFCREFLTNRVYELDDARMSACTDLAIREYSLAEANGEIEKLYARLEVMKNDKASSKLSLKLAKLQNELWLLQKRLTKAEREIKAAKKLRSSGRQQEAGVQQLWDFIGQLSREMEAWMLAQELKSSATVAELHADVAEITANLEVTNLEGAASLKQMEMYLEKRLGDIDSSTEGKLKELTLVMKNNCRKKVDALGEAMKRWYAEQRRREQIESDSRIWLEKLLKKVPEVGATHEGATVEANRPKVGQPKDEKRCCLGRLMQLMTKPQPQQLAADRQATNATRPNERSNNIQCLVKKIALDVDKVKVAREYWQSEARYKDV